MRILLYGFMLFSTINLFAMHVNREIHLLAMQASQKINEELLFTATLNNDAKKIKELLDKKTVNINARNEDGKTPVCLAVARGKNEALKELLRYNSDVNLPDNDGWTPLKKAANYNRIESARLLLVAGAKPNQADKEGYTPLLNAYQNLEMTRLLLEAGADANHSAPDGRTALYMALGDSKIDVVELLVKHGAQDSSRCISNGFNARDLANANARDTHSSFGITEAQKCANFLNQKFGE